MYYFGVIERPTTTVRLELGETDMDFASGCLSTTSGFATLLEKGPRACNEAPSLACFSTYFPGSVQDSTLWQVPLETCSSEGAAARVSPESDSDAERKHSVDNDAHSSRMHCDQTLIQSIRRETTVKCASLLHNTMYLFFWNVSDAITFYKKNSANYKTSFASKYSYEQEKCRVEQRHTLRSIRVDVSPATGSDAASKLQRVSALVDTGLLNLKKDAAACRGNALNEFNERVLFFNRISKFFVMEEVKRIEAMFRAGNYEMILANAKELCVGSRTNILIQNVLKTIDPGRLLEFVLRLEYDIGPISATKYGAYVIQTILRLAATPEIQRVVSKYFEKYSQFLLTHPLGNYSLQTIGSFDPEFLSQAFLKNFKVTVKSSIGRKVLKRSLGVFANKTEELLEALHECDAAMQKDILRFIEKTTVAANAGLVQKNAG